MPRSPVVHVDGVIDAIQNSPHPFVSTGELADYFDVTPQTIRNNEDRLTDDERVRTAVVSKNTLFYLVDGPEAGESEESAPAKPESAARAGQLPVLSSATVSRLGTAVAAFLGAVLGTLAL